MLYLYYLNILNLMLIVAMKHKVQDAMSHNVGVFLFVMLRAGMIWNKKWSEPIRVDDKWNPHKHIAHVGFTLAADLCSGWDPH